MKMNFKKFCVSVFLTLILGSGCAHILSHGQDLSNRQNLDVIQRQIQGGQADEAIQQLQDINSRQPSVRSRILLGQAYQAKGQKYYDQSLEYYEAALNLSPDDAEARLNLGRAYFQQNQYSQAIDTLKPLAWQSSPPSQAVRYLAMAYWKMGRLNTAQLEFERLKNLEPQSAEAEYYLALICEEKGVYEEALEHYAEVQKISPSCEYADLTRQHVADIQAKGFSDGLQEIQDEEVRDLIKNAPDAKDYPEAGAMVLLDEELHSVHSNNTMTTRIHRLIKIFNERGKGFGEVGLHYDSSDETVTVDLARTILQNGRIIQVGKKSMRDLAPWSGFPLYSNAKVKVISMPEVVDGSIIEYKATIRSSKMLNENDFQMRMDLQGHEPSIVQRMIIDIPQDRALKVQQVRTSPDIKPQIVQHDGRQIYTWEVRDTSEIIPEPMMPPWTDIMPVIRVSSFKDWDSIGNWFKSLAKDQLQADDDIRREVARLVKDAPTPQERARKIFNFMTKEVRYVGLEYGTSGYKPHKATEIFQNKYGDCKDQAALLVTMLREAGIAAHLVLINTKSSGKVMREIPMMQFNHCIAVAEIDNKLVWLDPTCETCAYGEVPDEDQQCQALVIFDDGPRFVETPLIEPELNKLTKNIALEIKSGGNVEGSTRMITAGTYSIGYRGLRYTKPIKRKDMLEGMINDMYPGGKLLDYTIEGLEDTTHPVQFDIKYTGPSYLKKAGPLAIFHMPGVGRSASGVAREKRTYPIMFDTTSMSEVNIEVKIPSEYQVRYVPEEVKLELPYISYWAEYTIKEGVILYHERSVIRQTEVPVSAYNDYKQFEERIAQETEKPIILEEKLPKPEQTAQAAIE